MPSLRIGVLALQGAFAEHIQSLSKCGAEAIEVRKFSHLQGLDGLIIPGGESTVMSKLMVEEGLFGPVRALGLQGLPLFGTCAGLVMLSKDIAEYEGQATLALLDVKVRRNAFGRQVDSFCTTLLCALPNSATKRCRKDKELETTKTAFPAVFIRAPLIETVGESVRVLASIEGKAVAVEQGNIMACSFHPELTDDTRWHQVFLQKALHYKANTTKN